MPSAQKQRITVVVEHFIAPPTAVFVSSITKSLKVAGLEASVRGKYDHDPKFLALPDISSSTSYLLDAVAEAQQSTPESSLTAFLVATQTEFIDVSTNLKQTHGILFLPACDTYGNEWMYAHFTNPKVPLFIIEAVTKMFDDVLSGREGACKQPSEEASETAARAIGAIKSGFKNAFEVAYAPTSNTPM